MTNLVVMLLVWCTGVVLCYAWGLGRSLRRVFREEAVPEPADGPPTSAPGDGRVLSYAKPPAKLGVFRRWPVLQALVDGIVVVVLMLPLALPILAAVYMHVWVELSLVFGAAIGVTVIAVVLVARRGLEDVVGQPAAANWRLGRVVLCWIGVFVLVWATLAWRTQHLLDATLAKADELGQRLEMRSADGASAVEVYHQAGIGLTKPFEFNSDWELMTFQGQMSPPPGFPEAHAFRVLLLHRAAAFQTSGLNPPASEYSLGTPLPHATQLRQAASLLQQHAINEARDGRVEPAIADINAMYGLGRHAAQGLGMAKAMAGWDIHMMAFDTLQQVLPFVQDTHTLDLLRLPDAAECMPVIRRAAEGEFGVRHRRTLVQWLRAETPLGSAPMTRSAPRGASSTLSVFMFVYRVPMGEVEVDATDEVAGAFPQCIAQSPQVAAKTSAATDGRILSMRSRTLLTGVMVFGIGRHIDRYVEMAAMCDLSRAALAATRFRLQHGRLPSSFEELVAAGLLPAVPVDPFDGKPMRFAVHKDCVFIYTIGRNRTDNGGCPYMLRRGVDITESNPGFILSDRPLWELDLVPPGFAPATQDLVPPGFVPATQESESQ